MGEMVDSFRVMTSSMTS